MSYFKKGQHVCCKYNGSGNGDLIVGRVDSVRSNGIVLLTNLLTDGRSSKTSTNLRRRNVIVTKRQAVVLVGVFREKGRPAARLAAVHMAESLGLRRKPRVARPKSNGTVDHVGPLVAAARALDDDDFRAFTATIYKEVLSFYGVA